MLRTNSGVLRPKWDIFIALPLPQGSGGSQKRRQRMGKRTVMLSSEYDDVAVGRNAPTAAELACTSIRSVQGQQQP